MKLRVFPHRRFDTKGADGQANGFLIPVYNVHEQFLPAERAPQQVYLSVCGIGARKGPHLHQKRWGYLTCVRGNARVVAKFGDEYVVAYTGQDHGYQTIEIPAGIPNCLENIGDVDAYIINTPSPAWRPEDPDEHPVTEWNPPSGL
jgi:dTDP-4-dehydrorhamnose 3,5-epimerase-like enzyme